ncbi:hypothetical protein G7Y79_00009g027000 [Physcia stellaris]|nr:hypothetical protein G7Y79_00009g027000 [Physcia stellaris]
MKQIRRLQLNFSPESGYDTALNALQGLGLPIKDKNQPAIQPTPAPPAPPGSFQPYQQMLPPPQPARLLPGAEFTYRPNTSNGFDYRPSSSAPDSYTERPYTAPDPISFSQMLPPKRELPPGMRLLMSNFRVDTEASVQRAQASEPKQPSAKPPAKERKVQAKPTKPKDTMKKSPLEAPKTPVTKSNTTHETTAESGIETSVQVLTSTPAPKKKAPAQISRLQTATTGSDSVLLSSSLENVAEGAGLPALENLRQIGPIELKIKQSLKAAALAGSSASGTNPTEPTESTSEGQRQPLVLRTGRKAMAEITSNTTNREPTPSTPATTTASGARAESSPRPNIEEISPSEFMSSLEGFVREYQHLPAPRPQPTAAEDLAAYAAQPDEVRQAVIKDLILECLGDENFVKLAEDVDAEWRRIGLGF